MRETPATSKGRGDVEKSDEGRVTGFVSGRLLTISADGDRSETFRLDAGDVTAVVEPGIAGGARVKVVESIDATGKRTVAVRLAPAPRQGEGRSAPPAGGPCRDGAPGAPGTKGGTP